MSEISKRKILVTGGCGKIGSYFVRFASDRYAIRVVDKAAWDPEKFGPFSGESLVADLQDLTACRRACEGMDMVIHLAADPSPEAGFEDSLLGNNIIATYNMFRAAHEARCRRFIFASSAHAVAAYPPDVQIKVNMPVRPTNLYGVSKCFGEALAAHFAFNEGLPGIVLRIGAYVFPDRPEDLSASEQDAFLSPDDFNDLLIKCLETPQITFAIAHAISNNKFKRLDLTETRDLLGYQPKADAFELFGNISKHK
ncbi:MAG TPA: NAD(P)-dependent oxidoreductase [Anaerolineales bacterium]|nr:NAD(P)-dependent oxidoreductase [Anaerolineales bacterium]